MLRYTLLTVVLVLLSACDAAGVAPQTADAPTSHIKKDGDFGPIVISIDYDETQGDLRDGTLAIAPASKGAPELQPDEIRRVSVLSADGRWTVVDDLRWADGRLDARGTFVPPGDVAAVLLHPPTGGPFGWQFEKGLDLRAMTWTHLDAWGREVRSAPCEPGTCFETLYEAFDQAERTASSFRSGAVVCDEDSNEI